MKSTAELFPSPSEGKLGLAKWHKLQKTVSQSHLNTVSTIANETIIKNIDFLLTQLFANDGALTGFFKSATGRQSSKKILNYNGKTLNIEKYKWKNKQEFNSNLKEKLEAKLSYLTNEENVKKMKSNTE